MFKGIMARLFGGLKKESASLIGTSPSERQAESIRLHTLHKDTGKCPDCGQSELIEGPEGGSSVNTVCPHCGNRFTFFHGYGLVSRIGA